MTVVPAALRGGHHVWVDISVTCDGANRCLFSSDDDGHLYRSQTTLADFPNGTSQPVIAMQDSNPSNLYEASHCCRLNNIHVDRHRLRFTVGDQPARPT